MYEYHVCELEYRGDPRSYKNYLSDSENKAWKLVNHTRTEPKRDSVWSSEMLRKDENHPVSLASNR